MLPGPITREQLARFGREWKQGQHVIVSGPTGSGKTELARNIDEIRVRAGSFLIVLVMKIEPDQTILNSYKGFTRWKDWRKPRSTEKRILLWPDLKGMPALEAVEIQREIFARALNQLSASRGWMIHVDEGLYASSPRLLGLDRQIEIISIMGRSARNTLLTLMQRPAHVPLTVYGGAAHAFLGRTRERADLDRLKEMNGRLGSREIAGRLSNLNLHEFLWVPIATDGMPEIVNLRR